MATIPDPHLAMVSPVTPRTPQGFQPGEDRRWCFVHEVLVR
ncbi:hypothetical protein [Streptomyces sp. WAC06614]|nr:hypothetical protein [Streptomyces sp. WAC06614]